jgi:hypothetical protein
MPAAKHELPNRKGREALIADAPGMGLPDPYAGSISWQVLLDETQTTISRRSLADKFFGILGWHEDIETAVQLAKEAKARRKRLRREARRHAGNPPLEPERLDQFFRTEKEVKYDQHIGPTRRRSKQKEKRRGRKRQIGKSTKVEALKGGYRPPVAGPPQQEAPRDPPPYFVREQGAAPSQTAAPPIVKRRYPGDPIR